jgi:hypothetical protein
VSDRDDVVLTMKGVGYFDYGRLREAVGRILAEWGSTDGTTFTLSFAPTPDPGVLAVPYCPRWTKERPTVAGWWWWRNAAKARPRVVEAVVFEGAIWLYDGDAYIDPATWGHCEFAGPIPPPEPEA